MENLNPQTKVKEITLTLEGDLMDGGSVDYRTVFDVIDGSVGAIDGFSRIANFNQVVSFRVKPPKEKCFEITIQAVQLLTVATLPLIESAGTIKDIVSFYIEYLKIKKALKGEELKKENIQTNSNGDVFIKNNSGVIVYSDNRKIVNMSIISKAVDDPQINKKIDKIVSALERNEQVDTLTFSDHEDERVTDLTISKQETDYFKYKEKIEESSDSLVGYVRKIDNKTNNGMITVLENDKEKSVLFELDIRDIGALDKVVRNLALAEANKTRVVFFGEKTLDSKGVIKKLIVRDVDIVDKALML